jgi:hypothetical protein
MSIGKVQKWVLTSLVAVTIGHLSLGMVLAAVAAPEERLDSRVGLLVIAGLFGLIAVGVARLIHQWRLLTPWLLLGLLPALVGGYLEFWH